METDTAGSQAAVGQLAVLMLLMLTFTHWSVERKHPEYTFKVSIMLFQMNVKSLQSFKYQSADK